MATPVTYNYIADWAKRLRGRTFTQFRNKVTWTKWVNLLAQQAQDLEDSLQSMFTIYDIDNSAGVMLDFVGRVIGQQRLGASDATYRLYLKARVQADRSTGTPENLFSVFRALFGTDILPTYFPGFVKQFAISLNRAIDATGANAALQFLRDAKEAGAKGILKWQYVEDAEAFAFDSGGLGFDVGSYIGAAVAR